MQQSITVLNQLCADLGGTTTHKFQINALNEICTLAGGTGNHMYVIQALNELCTLYSATAGHTYLIDALRSLYTTLGGTGSFQTDVQYYSAIQQAGLLNVLPSVLRDDNTFLYYDVLESRCLTKNEANLVASLNDYFISGRNVTQSDDAKKPLLNAEGVYFENNVLKSAAFELNQPTTIYFLVKQNNWVSNRVFFDGNTTNSGTLAKYGTTPNIIATTNGANLVNNNTFPVGEFGLVRVIFNGANSSVQVNNLTKSAGNAGLGNMGGLTLGNYGNNTLSHFARFTMKAIVIRKVSDSDANQQIIYDFLAAKHSQILNSARLLAISGQSNAIGYYPTDASLPEGYSGDQENIKIYYNDFTNGSFELMNPAVNCGYDWIADPHDNTGWGAEQSAAHELQVATNQDVIVVKSGDNGKQIGYWDTGQQAFDQLVAGLVKAVTNDDPLISYKNYLTKSMLWMQGESDAIAAVSTVAYEAKLRDLIARIRAAHASLADIQFVMVKLSDLMTGFSLDATKRGNINTAFANVAADTTGTIVLDPDLLPGIALRADNLHYTSASLILIGSKWKTLMTI